MSSGTIPADAIGALVDVILHPPTIHGRPDLTASRALNGMTLEGEHLRVLTDALGYSDANVDALTEVLVRHAADDEIFARLWRERARVDIGTFMRSASLRPDGGQSMLTFFRGVLKAGQHAGVGLGDGRRVLKDLVQRLARS